MQNIAHNFTTADSTATSAQTYRIVIDGLAENIAIGRVTDIQYDYWENFYESTDKRKKLDAIIDGYRKDYSHSDGHIYVPNYLNFMDDKYWMEHNDIDGLFGARANNQYTFVMVYDENNSLIFKSKLNKADLNQHGVQYTLNKTIDVDNDPTVSHYVVFVDTERGAFCNSEFTLSDPFDPSKLSLGYTSFEEEEYVTEIFYDGIEIDNDDNDSCSDGLDVYFYKK